MERIEPQSTSVNDPEIARTAALGRATRVAVAVAVSLTVAKLLVGLFVDSMAVIASAADSLLDVAASSLNLVAIRVALAPPDANHRFGHAKAEALASGAQAFLIGGSALYLIVEGTHRLLSPVELRRPIAALVVMALSALASALLVGYLRRVARATGSLALGADATHYSTDVLANLGVLGGVAAISLGAPREIDGLLAIAVALYVGGSARGLFREAARVLMDEELPASDRSRIEQILRSFVDSGEIRGWHRLRTRAAGRSAFVEVHLEMDAALALAQAHRAGDRVEQAIREAMPHADVIFHLDVERDEP